MGQGPKAGCTFCLDYDLHLYNQQGVYTLLLVR